MLRLKTLVLYSPRMEVVRDFYNRLGVNFKEEKHGQGPKHYAGMLRGNIVLEIYPIINKQIPSKMLMEIAVSDIAGTLENLKGKYTEYTGWEIPIPVDTGNGLEVSIFDPDNRTVMLVQEQTYRKAI